MRHNLTEHLHLLVYVVEIPRRNRYIVDWRFVEDQCVLREVAIEIKL